MTGKLFSSVKTNFLEEKFSKSWIWVEISLIGNNEDHVGKLFMKISLFGPYWSSDCSTHFCAMFK